MSIETASRKSLSILLIVFSAMLGAAVLDEISYNRLDATMQRSIEDRFKHHSTKVGAWVMDRQYVTEKIGVEVESLPSYQWAQQHSEMP